MPFSETTLHFKQDKAKHHTPSIKTVWLCFIAQVLHWTADKTNKEDPGALSSSNHI